MTQHYQRPLFLTSKRIPAAREPIAAGNLASAETQSSPRHRFVERPMKRVRGMEETDSLVCANSGKEPR